MFCAHTSNVHSSLLIFYIKTSLCTPRREDQPCFCGEPECRGSLGGKKIDASRSLSESGVSIGSFVGACAVCLRPYPPDILTVQRCGAVH